MQIHKGRKLKIQISEKNITIFKELFNWQEIPEISKEYMPALADAMGINLSSNEILIKTSFLNYRDYQIMSVEGKPLFHIKRMWEAGSFKEILGLELGRLLDPDLCIPNYVFGLFTSRFLRNPIPFVTTAWIFGKNIEKKEAINYAFELGKQYEFGRWLSLYDCHPRHYFIQPDKSIRRIDYGLAFHNLNKLYEGFADIWPQDLLQHPRFLEGIKYEYTKIKMRFEILENEIKSILEKVAQVELDDYINVRGYLLKASLLEYWEREEITDNCGNLKKSYNFLHSPVVSSSNLCN